MEDKEKKIGYIIAALEQHIPLLIHKVIDEFYSPESAGKIGKGLAEFYKALRDGGVPEGAALEMVKDYASNLTFKGMGQMYRQMPPMGGMMGGHMMGGPMGMGPMMGPMMKKHMKRMWHEGKDEELEKEEA
jgi:hypothetical protein